MVATILGVKGLWGNGRNACSDQYSWQWSLQISALAKVGHNDFYMTNYTIANLEIIPQNNIYYSSMSITRSVMAIFAFDYFARISQASWYLWNRLLIIILFLFTIYWCDNNPIVLTSVSFANWYFYAKAAHKHEMYEGRKRDWLFVFQGLIICSPGLHSKIGKI